MNTKPIPKNYQTVTPYIVASDGNALIEFLILAFEGEVTERIAGEDGGLMHAELKIGTSMVMVGQAREGVPGMEIMLYVYVEDCDAVYDRAIKAGGSSIMEPQAQFYGDRAGAVRDVCNNQWWIATRVEDLSQEELQKRTREARS